ncbi:hypothetical protein OIO90_003379 [Microbotryomycetes sp. JL221]|nr:hypothetical protein OIO90_003379 [Microbotryomycetes sp. JL221]
MSSQHDYTRQDGIILNDSLLQRCESPEPAVFDTGAAGKTTGPIYARVPARDGDKMNVKILKLVENGDVSRGTHVATPESRGGSLSSASLDSEASRQNSLKPLA